MKLSNNAIGISGLIVSILYIFDIDVDITQIDQAIASVVALYSLFKLIKNQVTRPDTHKFFFKK